VKDAVCIEAEEASSSSQVCIDAVCVTHGGGGGGARGEGGRVTSHSKPTYPPTATLLIWHRRRSKGEGGMGGVGGVGVGGVGSLSSNPAGGKGGGEGGREGVVVCLAWRAGRDVGGAGKGRGGVTVRCETLMGWVRRWKLRGVREPLERLLIDTHSLPQVLLMCC
jgi:hypothetical protein